MAISVDDIAYVNIATDVKAERRIEKPKHGHLVAQSLHKESKIDLYTLTFNSAPQSSVFIYPADFLLSQEKILQLDQFIKISNRLTGREFKDTNMEDLNALFLREARPLISSWDQVYNYGKARIIYHSFLFKSAVYLKSVIDSLKAK